MGQPLTDRFVRIGAQNARLVLAGAALVVVAVVALGLLAAGVEGVEVLATLLFLPVFCVGLFAGRTAGLAAACGAAAVYVLMRQPDIDAAGTAAFMILSAVRALCYGIVAHVGVRAGDLVDAMPAIDEWSASRGLRRGNLASTADAARWVATLAAPEVSARDAQAPPSGFDVPPSNPWGDLHMLKTSTGGYRWEPAEAAWDPGPGPEPVPPWAPANGGGAADWAPPVGSAWGAGADVDESERWPTPESPWIDPAVHAEGGDYGHRSGEVGAEADPGADIHDGRGADTVRYHDEIPGDSEEWEDQAVADDVDAASAIRSLSPWLDTSEVITPPPPVEWADGLPEPPPLSPIGGTPAVSLGPLGGDTPLPEPPAVGGPTGHGPVPEPLASEPSLDEAPIGYEPEVEPLRSGSDFQPGEPEPSATPPPPIPGRVRAAPVAGDELPSIDAETRLWTARFLRDALITEQRRAVDHWHPFALVLVRVPDEPLAKLSYRRQVTLLRELGHQFVAGGVVEHLVHVPDGDQHWFAVVLPETDRSGAHVFEARLRIGIGGYLRNRGLSLGELRSASLSSPEDDESLGAIWDALIGPLPEGWRAGPETIDAAGPLHSSGAG